MSKQIIKDRIDNLRKTLTTNDLDAIIVPSADPHLSEYLPEYWQARKWLSGFTGSVGTLVVTKDFAGLWTDSRYWVQAADQLADTGISLQKLQKGAPNHIDWLADHLSEGSSVAVDGNVLSLAEQDRLTDAFDDKEIRLITEQDVLTEIWQERPALPSAKLFAHDDDFLSQSAKDKLAAVREQLQASGATHHLISSLDDIAWLTNLRGSDVDYNPVFLAHMLITQNDATLFVDINKVSSEITTLLEAAGIKVAEYDTIKAALSELTPDDLLLLDPNKVAVGTLAQLNDDIHMIERIAPSTLLKSVKSDADIEHVREAMRQDGAALCEFFSSFEQRLAAGERLSELDVDSMLIDVRSKQPNYVSPSFPTIAGYNENGALPHYRAVEDKFSYLDGDGLLLIDSGAQYKNGTTDITRVVGIGKVSDEQKRDFTMVLRAHIALAVASFPDGIASPLIDAICRAPLWQAQMDYGHGTGHGVGYFLNVHEGPQVIAYAASTPPERAMKAGMISSNEPGLYREGKWGIRIENLVVNQPVTNPTETEFGDYLHFETVTLCPIDTRLIEPSLLRQDEKDWLNGYHQQVFNELKDRVAGDALTWLTERTQAI
ncbi:aminopeptidase P family protein [Psychrobacter pygoscelis]|uniref:aminopeptidase P family protein n=1 Tax=Psychrobacter pygoscelis TaxID=2488563 RepID=UPI00103BE24A|nr:aminopeptidase P family protein [Psychrobacter pygoscelis]